MIKTPSRLFLLLLSVVCLTGCSELFPSADDFNDIDLIENTTPVENMKVTNIRFSPNYKNIVVTADIVGNIGPYIFNDSDHVRLQVEETIDGIKHLDGCTPKLTKVVNVEAENYRDNKVGLLVLVDRSLPQAVLDDVKNTVVGFNAMFKYNNLLVAFMDSDKVSETVHSTPYVVENYFKRSNAKNVRLYRSILQKRQEMKQRAGLWRNFRYCSMLVFSDERVYEQDEPVDPDHFNLEAQMIAADSLAPRDISISYVSVSNHKDNTFHNSRNILKLFCTKNNGTFMNTFEGTTLRTLLHSSFHMKFPANEFHLVNPDQKVYRGNEHVMHIKVFDRAKDSLVASCSTKVLLGSIESPVIVNDYGRAYVLTAGILLGALVFLVIYVIMQFLVPYIRYRMFLKRYVIAYKGPNMSNNQTLVAESCYLCKAPFQIGDRIVTKCKHTVHKSCWDENGYHCPEYSDRCKTGSHYYNREHLTDEHNANFYMKWILMAIGCATLAWALQLLVGNIIDKISPLGTGQLPSVGLFLGLFLTIGVSLLSAHRPYRKVRASSIALRAIIAGIGCSLAFYLTGHFANTLGIHRYVFSIDWIPWTLSGYIIALCAIWKTPTRLRRSLLWAGIVLGVLSTYLWLIIFIRYQFNFQVLILLSFSFFSIGLALSIAMTVPRTERYFLKVEGAVKEMDIALYKWFRNRREAIFTLGRSVDCSLQLSWDINSDVAPLQAQIEMTGDRPYLTAIEDGVIVKGKPLEIGQKSLLYHGKSFTIGKTTFTYLEKDS